MEKEFSGLFHFTADTIWFDKVLIHINGCSPTRLHMICSQLLSLRIMNIK